MKTINFIDKNSSIIITISSENEEEARTEIKERMCYFDNSFRTEEIDEGE